MRIIDPSVELINAPTYDALLNTIEVAGRVCYKSEDKIQEGSAEKFIAGIIKRGHEAVLEHGVLTVKFICDRGVSHEIVRHRIASYCQESTRYCNYSQDKFGNELTFIKPYFAEPHTALYSTWVIAMAEAEKAYFDLLDFGAKPEDARSVLPNSIKTEFICTMNLREWRHFFRLRCAPAAHPAMREISIPLLAEFREMLPVVFEDIPF